MPILTDHSPQTRRLAWRAAILAGTVTLCGAIDAGRGARAEGPWCAYDYGYNQYQNCGYHTFQQCLDSVSGVGGFCRPNPYVVSAPPPGYGQAERYEPGYADRRASRRDPYRY